MNFIAFLLALVAVFCFLLAAYGAHGAAATDGTRGRAWHFGWVGLALLTISWMVQIIIATGSKITVGGH